METFNYKKLKSLKLTKKKTENANKNNKNLIRLYIKKINNKYV